MRELLAAQAAKFAVPTLGLPEPVRAQPLKLSVPFVLTCAPKADAS